MISVQIISQKNQKIDNLIDSLSWCDDIIVEEPSSNLSETRESLIHRAKHEWMLLLEPWETLSESPVVSHPKAYYLPILNNNVISYEVRLWHKSLGLKFVNPIYEHLDIKTNDVLNCFIHSNGQRKHNLYEIEGWKKRDSLSIKPIYYEAFYYLQSKEWNKFLSKAIQYLFKENKTTNSYIMMRYYTAIVYLYQNKIKEALQHTMPCIAIKPLLAEFWCLLGDIYHTFDNVKAQRFYENAIVLGKNRKFDTLPIEISKYEEYPEEMMAKCQKIVSKTKLGVCRKPS